MCVIHQEAPAVRDDLIRVKLDHAGIRILPFNQHLAAGKMFGHIPCCIILLTPNCVSDTLNCP